MSRPTLEVADILRVSGNSFVKRHGSHLAPRHRKVMDAIVRCRTAALGGHRDRCSGCGHQAISYNSCRNRHCPKCQDNARALWLAARSAELLPAPHFHIVFTLPHELSALVLQNKRLLYDLLFRASAAKFSKSLATRSIWVPTSVCSACSILTHATHPRAHSYRNSLRAGPLQLPNRSLLGSRRNLPCLRDLAGKDAVTAGIAHSNPIATHRLRHATGFLQTTLSNLPRQSAQQVQLCARGSPDRVLTFIVSN
jgi:hypothetical protein